MLLTMFAIIIHLWLKQMHDSGNERPLSNWTLLLIKSKSSIPWRIASHLSSSSTPIDRNVENTEIMPTTIVMNNADQWIIAAIVARLLFAFLYLIVYILLILILLT